MSLNQPEEKFVAYFIYKDLDIIDSTRHKSLKYSKNNTHTVNLEDESMCSN